MSLQRRLMLYLLLCAPLVWAVALWVSVDRARHEVNELFDSEMIRLARQVQATLGPPAAAVAGSAPAALPPAQGPASAGWLGNPTGEADVEDLAVVVWDAAGGRLLSDREGVQLPYLPQATGFVDLDLDNNSWRVFYLQSPQGQWLVAAGQRSYERDELVYNLTASQVLPWLLVLPVLLVAMAWAVRRALAPVRQLAGELQARRADDLQPVAEAGNPTELRPLLAAMNGLFQRIEQAMARERQFTADAAHELRTPLAVLRVQWDVVRRSSEPAERAHAEARLGLGLDRLERLVTQMLALSRLEGQALPGPVQEIDWTVVVEQALSDCLLLAERRQIEFACEFPPAGQHPLPLQGDVALLTVMLRNLLDNAARYAPAGSTVWLRLSPTQLLVENEGPALAPEQLARLGERFYRPDGQDEVGSGLGLSIVQRVAAWHGLVLRCGPLQAGQGVQMCLEFGDAPQAAVAAPVPPVLQAGAAR